MKVIGVGHKTGTFEGKPYDYFNLYCNDQDEKFTERFGECPKIIKVRAAILYQIVAPDKTEKLIGRDLAFYYDLNKRVSKVETV